jgi:hypothetical protein
MTVYLYDYMYSTKYALTKLVLESFIDLFVSAALSIHLLSSSENIMLNIENFQDKIDLIMAIIFMIYLTLLPFRVFKMFLKYYDSKEME